MKAFNSKQFQIKNMPPIAGSIAWVRQLLQRITLPMEIFRKHENLFANGENKKLVNEFNSSLLQLAAIEKKCYELFQDNA